MFGPFVVEFLLPNSTSSLAAWAAELFQAEDDGEEDDTRMMNNGVFTIDKDTEEDEWRGLKRRLLFCPDVSGAADYIVLQLLIIYNLLLLMVHIQRSSCLVALVEEE